MKMTFRWYGPDDSITLDHIRQIPCMTERWAQCIWQEYGKLLKRKENKMKLPFEIDLSGKVVVITGAGGVLCSMFAQALAKTGAK